MYRQQCSCRRFWPTLDDCLAGVHTAFVTLHVGAGTFLPVKVEETTDHQMHSEWGTIPAATLKLVNDTRSAGAAVVPVGSTSLRLLETAADDTGILRPFTGETDIFMTPGHRFKIADKMITNFHLPRSTLFMLVAAFAGLEKIISQRDKGSSIGFGAEVKNTEDKKTGEWMKSLEPEDLLKYGLIPEFIGRLPIIATLEDLDEKSLIKILQEPKNSLIKQYQELFKLEGAKLVFKDTAIREIAQKAINKKTGARGLRSILESVLLKTMFDLPSMENVNEVIVDSGAAKGQSQPIIVHSKNAQKDKDKDKSKTSAA